MSDPTAADTDVTVPPTTTPSETDATRADTATAETEAESVQTATGDVAAADVATEAPALGDLPSKEALLEALKVVKDPEIPLNVVDLGLIYNVDIKTGGEVDIDMTLTSMGCPVQDMIQADAELACMQVEGVKKVTVEFVWSPPWSPAKMSEDGKKQMRMFGFNL